MLYANELGGGATEMYHRALGAELGSACGHVHGHGRPHGLGNEHLWRSRADVDARVPGIPSAESHSRDPPRRQQSWQDVANRSKWEDFCDFMCVVCCYVEDEGRASGRVRERQREPSYGGRVGDRFASGY